MTAYWFFDALAQRRDCSRGDRLMNGYRLLVIGYRLVNEWFYDALAHRRNVSCGD